ncbi:hypothetical protein WLQ65_05820 [Pseudoalteromonas piscicida]|uniref:hypothetical protein n=1 Tax=Pseudoalteromonas piscicida TaxID=43662 RepID=UPI0030C93D77
MTYATRALMLLLTENMGGTFASPSTVRKHKTRLTGATKMNNDIEQSLDTLFDTTAAINSFITALAESLTPDVAARMVPTLDLSIDEMEQAPQVNQSALLLLTGWRNHLAQRSQPQLSVRRLAALSTCH